MGCAIAAKELIPPGGIIKETRNFILIQDPEVPIKNFLIINSKRHIRSIAQLSLEENTELFELCYQARKALLNFDDIVDCMLIQEERSGHFHLWILPWYAWMDAGFDKSLTSVRAIMQYARENRMAKEYQDEIAAAVEALRGMLDDPAAYISNTPTNIE